MRYRKLENPPVEASRWFKNGDHPLDYAEDVQGWEGMHYITYPAAHAKEKDWEGAVVRRFRHPYISGDKVCNDCGNTMNDHGHIELLTAGAHSSSVCPGDWIVTGTDGKYSIVSDSKFLTTYEEVKDLQ